MEVKKSPNANLEKSKSLSVLMGLIVALSIVFVSFEWGTREIQVAQRDFSGEILVEEELLYNIPEDVPPPPPPPPTPVVAEELNVVDDNVDLEQHEILSSEDDQNSGQPEHFAPPAIVDDEEESTDQIFRIVEEMPVFPGGEQELLRFINKSVKYPVIAQENGIQGRVICTFTVNQDGSVVDAEVVRGIDPSLDKEALRVIGVMPKWQPGKQRGKPVRVRYTLPIVFRLQ